MLPPPFKSLCPPPNHGMMRERPFDCQMICDVKRCVMYQVMTHHLYFFHVTLLLKHPPQIGDDYNQDFVLVKLDFI